VLGIVNDANQPFFLQLGCGLMTQQLLMACRQQVNRQDLHLKVSYAPLVVCSGIKQLCSAAAAAAAADD
jgi:hypothetical protein